jgi:transposase
MRGWDARSDALFSYVSCEARVPKDHPLRPIRRIVDEALAALSLEFEKLYARFGRPSIPPERLLRALLLQAFYSVRSEKQLVEQLDYNLLFRWFVGLSLDDEVWDETVFTKNRERLIEGDHRQEVHGQSARSRAGQGVVVGRPFLGRWHADRSMGQHEELSPQGRQR